MSNRFKKVLALILVVTLSVGSVAFADGAYKSTDNNIVNQPQSSAYISSYNGAIIPKGNGRFNIEFDVTGTGTMSQLGATYIRIYKNGTQVDSFWNTSSGRSGMMAYNTFIMSDAESYQGVSGSTYFAKITFFAKNSSGSDAKVFTTSSVRV